MRPKRIYKAPNGRFYYLDKGVRKFVKIVPANKKLILKKKIRPRKKPSKNTRKKTAFAINPKKSLQQLEAPAQYALPAIIPVEKKPIVQIQDVAKQEITKKKIQEVAEETEKKKQELAEEKEKKKQADKRAILEKSVRANKNIQKNIDARFKRYKDITGYSDVNERYAWKKFQKTKEYNNPGVSDSEDSDIKHIRPLFLYDYEPESVMRKVDLEKEKALPIKRGRKPLRSRDTEREALSAVSTDPELDTLLYKEHLIPESSDDDRSLTEGRGSSGLFNTDIEDIMKGLKNICPVIPSDKIGMLLDYVKEGMPKFGAIINTNPSESDGSGQDGFRVGHWRAIFFDNDEDYVSAEYFDPLCEGPIPTKLKAIMKKIAKKMNPEDFALIKENNLKRQMDSTSTCGYHCIKFVDDRYNNIPWSEATGYDDYMEKHKPDDSEAGEKSLVKPIKKYDKYI